MYKLSCGPGVGRLDGRITRSSLGREQRTTALARNTPPRRTRACYGTFLLRVGPHPAFLRQDLFGGRSTVNGGSLLAIALPCHEHRIRGLGDTGHRTPQLIHGVASAQEFQIIRPRYAVHSLSPQQPE